MRIAAIETRRYRYPLDPPFAPAWDPVPRTHQDATIAVVRSDDGSEGYASGDALPDRELLERLLVGVDPTDTSTVHGIVETVDLHHGRNWIVEVAVWDLVARASDQPVWRLLGGERDRIGAYASSGELVPADERVRRCQALRDAGVRATKIRLHSQDWRLDLPVIEAVREAVPEVEIMVDANQGWRMPGDLTPRWDFETALAFARELERLGAYWLEEPLPTEDVEGYAALGREVDLRIAAGEFVRSTAEARDLVMRGGVDVVQTDVVLVGGILRERFFPEDKASLAYLDLDVAGERAGAAGPPPAQADGAGQADSGRRHRRNRPRARCRLRHRLFDRAAGQLAGSVVGLEEEASLARQAADMLPWAGAAERQDRDGRAGARLRRPRGLMT